MLLKVRWPLEDLEGEVREPAWSTKVRLEPQVLWCAMSVTAVLGAWVHLGLTGGLATGRSALYTTCRHVCDLVAIR